MNLTHENIVILGLKRTVIAFHKRTGERLWTTHLSSGFGGDFVTVMADTSRVYAHTHGKMHCLDLATGRELWEDNLPGLGYGIASIAVPGQGTSSDTALAAKVHLDQTTAGSAGATSSGS